MTIVRSLLLALAVVMGAQAAWWNCFDNLCNLNVEVKGGVAPALLTHRGKLLLAFPQAETQSATLTPAFRLPTAKCLYKLPAYFGIKVGWLLSPCIETFAEFTVIHARSQNSLEHRFNIPGSDNTLTFNIRASHYTALAGYWGARYYTGRLANCLAFFVGGKVGIAHIRPICFGGNISYSMLSPETKLPAGTHYLATNTISGGAHIGLDAHVWRNLSCVLTAEIVALGQLRGNHNIVFPSALSPAHHAVAASFGTQVFFPITAGIMWQF